MSDSDIKVDGQIYSKQGTLDCKHGTGEDSEQWTFDVLVDEHGQTHLMNLDEGHHYIYLRSEKTFSQDLVDEVHEECPVDTVRGDIDFMMDDVEMTWFRAKEPFEVDSGPFAHTSEAMVIKSGDSTQLYMCVPTCRNTAGEFFSARYSAAKLPRKSFEEFHLPALSGRLEIVTAVLLLAGLGFGAATSNITPLNLFWGLAPWLFMLSMFSISRAFYEEALNLYLGVFFAHFATHYIDILMNGEAWDEPIAAQMESGRAVLVTLLFLGLRVFWLKGYKALTLGSYWGGGCSCSMMVVGVGIVSMDHQFSYFPWFRWYSGILPWGVVWFLVWCGFVFHHFRDFGNAPMLRDQMRNRIRRLQALCAGGLESAHPNSKELSDGFDDLEDAVKISNDAAVAALLPLGPSFILARDGTKHLSDVSHLSPHDRAVVTADLKTLAEDLGELAATCQEWGTGSLKHAELRVSPYLLTFDW
jgi:hypothetical protein